MIRTATLEGDRRPHLRIWPGILIVALQWLGWFLVPAIVPDTVLVGFAAGVLGGLAVLIWWLFFSRVPRLERWAAVVLIVAAVVATPPLILHKSIADGMMGIMFPIYVIPVMSLALVASAALSRRFADVPRRVSLAIGILLACGVFALLRTEGITGGGRSQLTWRWTKTNEEQLLEKGSSELVTPPAAVKADTPSVQPGKSAATADPAISPPKLAATAVTVNEAPPAGIAWPGFRGPHRDGRVSGVKIGTDWTSSPPVELWRRPIGPGWSSFAVGDDRLYTQEQRGDFETVACYEVTTGAPVWTYRTPTRFWESNAGAGPRGTPTLSGARVYALGATGTVTALDAATGSLIWTRNAGSDTGAQVPEWGFSSSPLVVNDLVIVAASGRLAAYDATTGDLRWLGPDVGVSYSSPHLLTIGGVEHVVLLTNSGATSVAPADGTVLWKHAWSGFTSLQPALTGDGGLLITTASAAGGIGTRRLSVARRSEGWIAEEVWTSIGLKPYFNDFVVHDGHAYGFDGGILSSIDLKDGKRNWKGGRYGHGQMILLSAQSLLLVVAEEGDLALVAASPDRFSEIARFRALQSKTWNHPVLVGGTLLVRNDEEMVAFRLARAD